jgi:hypothetical protein
VGGAFVLASMAVAGSARAVGEAAPGASDRADTRMAQAAAAPGEPSPKPARAAPEEIVPRVLPTERVFYGWEILATGEVGGALVALSVWVPSSEVSTTASTFVFLAGMPTFLLGGPVVHWTHDHWTKGLVSFSVNAAGAAIGGFIGGGVRCGRQNAPGDCSLKGFFDGLAVAGLTLPLLDAAVLGWEDLQVSDPVATRARAGRAIAVEPLLSVGPRSLALGVSGTF